MAYSTQRAFQHVPFLNEYPQRVCPLIQGIKLKTYAGPHDERSWSLSEQEKAQYLIDLVSCRMYDDDAAGDGLLGDLANKPHSSKKDPIGQFFSNAENNGQKDLLDSINAEKDYLRSRLDESQENLARAKEENQALNAVLSGDHDPNLLDDIRRKISQLRKSSKIDKNDENELLKMLDGLSKAHKNYNALNVQNSHLRKSLDKLSQKNDIPLEPETSTDVKYLQNEINRLRKELAQMRSLADKEIKRESKNLDEQGENDDENVENIKAERDALKEKCESFASVEGKIMEWKVDSEQFKAFRKKACMALRQKEEQLQNYRDRIEDSEYELKEMRKSLKGKDSLKEENQLLKEELCRCDCDLRGISALKSQIQLLSNELCEKNCTIEQYDMQFQQLLSVIDKLQGIATGEVRNLQEVDSQTENEDIEELAASTRATLDQISKELEHRKEVEADLAQSKAELETIRRESEEKEKASIAELIAIESENQKLKEDLRNTSIAVKESLAELDLEVKPDENCLNEIKRLQEFIAKLQAEHKDEINLLKKKSTDLLENEKAKGSEVDVTNNENRELKEKIQGLNEALEECKNKNKTQQDEIKKLDKRVAELLSTSESSLKEVGKLVDDINSVQNRNENLESVLGAVDYSDKCEKEIEKLQKLLDEEMKKGKSYEEQNKALKLDLDETKGMLQSAKLDNDKLIVDLQQKEKINNELKKLTNPDVKKEEKAEDSKEQKKETKPDIKKEEKEENSKEQKKETKPDLNKEEKEENSKEQKKESKPDLNKEEKAENSKEQKNETKPDIKKEEKEENSNEQKKETKPDLNKEENSKEQKKDTNPDKNKEKEKVSNEKKKQKTPDHNKKEPNSKKTINSNSDRTPKTAVEGSGEQGTVSKMKPSAKAPDATTLPALKEKKPTTKLNQLQKLHEATRNAERIYYEKEIEGHRMSNEILKNSLTKLTSKVQSGSVAEFEKEMRAVLDNFVQEICKWRCEKNIKKLTRVEEICKKILDYGINCLTYKELVYLHQKMSEAALKLRPNCLPSSETSTQKELQCCKCSGKICAPIIPKDIKILLEKISILECEVQNASEDLRKIKEDKEILTSDVDQSDSDTLRAFPSQSLLGSRKLLSRPKSSRFSYKIKEEEFQIPTKDRCG